MITRHEIAYFSMLSDRISYTLLTEKFETKSAKIAANPRT